MASTGGTQENIVSPWPPPDEVAALAGLPNRDLSYQATRLIIGEPPLPEGHPSLAAVALTVDTLLSPEPFNAENYLPTDACPTPASVDSLRYAIGRIMVFRSTLPKISPDFAQILESSDFSGFPDRPDYFPGYFADVLVGPRHLRRSVHDSYNRDDVRYAVGWLMGGIPTGYGGHYVFSSGELAEETRKDVLRHVIGRRVLDTHTEGARNGQ